LTYILVLTYVNILVLCSALMRKKGGRKKEKKEKNKKIKK
jgi:hypothetical protein